MREFTVSVTIEAKSALTERKLFAVAAIGGSASGNAGERLVETTLTVTAETLFKAISIGADQILAIVPGVVIAAEVMTTEEADRRLEQGEPMLGVTEIASLLGVSKQRASVLSRRRDFPNPVVALSHGKAWRRADVERWTETWDRKEGRPRHASA